MCQRLMEKKYTLNLKGRVTKTVGNKKYICKVILEKKGLDIQLHFLFIFTTKKRNCSLLLKFLPLLS